MKSKNRKLALEHSVLRSLKQLEISNRKILVAVSGGLDSVLLLHLLRLWQPYFRYELAVANVHHGKGTIRQMAFRKRSQKRVRALALEWNLPFFTNEISAEELKSEEELRNFRWEKLRKWQQQWGASLIAVAHHRDDQIETQILRLIRGTSRQGLQAMTQRDGEIVRPLLSLSRAQLEDYAIGRVNWSEDPSNKKTDSLRNWLRQIWLPQLEKRSAGSLKSLARSLETISQRPEGAQIETIAAGVWTNGGVRRKSLYVLTKKQQSLVVVEYLSRLGLKQFQQSHVNEIVRRLDTRRKSSTFTLLGLSWSIHPDLIRASRV